MKTECFLSVHRYPLDRTCVPDMLDKFRCKTASNDLPCLMIDRYRSSVCLYCKQHHYQAPLPKATNMINILQIDLVLVFTIPFQRRSYTMSSRPRGHCIIMNIMNYENKPERERDGSEVDVEMLGRLFGQLDFEVEHWDDLTKDVSQ